MSNTDTPQDTTLYILDSYGLIYRSYYAFINRPLVNLDGDNVSAIFGFFRNFHKILADHHPQFIVAALDSRTPTFRHQMFDQYKATRQKTPEDLHAQIPIIEKILTALGIPTVQQNGYEADDIIATLASECQKTGRPCRILTGDKDLMQLVNGNIAVMKPDKTGGWQLIDQEAVVGEWGVQPAQMLDYLSLTGDAADNIPGVPGVGDKTAQKLLTEYKDLDDIFAHAHEIPGALGKKLQTGQESAFFSRKLVELCTTVPINLDIAAYKVDNLNSEAAGKLLYKQGVPAVAKLFAPPAVESAPQGEAKPTDSAPDFAPIAEKIFTTLTENSGEYKAILEIAELTALVDRIVHAGTVAFDCETDSLNTREATMIGFSLSLEAGKGFYIPLTCAEPLLNPSFIPQIQAMQQLERIFSRPEMLVITHHGKFDYEVLRSNGLARPQCSFADTMIAAWLLNPERASFSLEALSETRLGLKTTSFESLVPKASLAKGMSFANVPLESAANYASEDADLTWQLWQLFKGELQQSGLLELFTGMEMKILPILAEMELVGIRIEKQKLAEYSVELAAQIEKTQADIFALVGHEFNIASTKQLQEVLFTERKLTPTKKTKTGYSTDTSVLEELAPWDPVPKKILEFRTLSKLLSTYVDTLPQQADKDDRVHTTFIQTGTATGRLSSRDPNLQNIPIRDEAGRRIRQAFTAPKGRVLVSADYSQIELVLLAHLSGDPNLCQAFIEGNDVHKATAKLIFGVPIEQVNADMRRTAKTINFGVMYGMSAFRLSNELGITRTRAKEFIDSYFKTYSGIQNFIHTTIENAEKKGYVETIMGRRRFIQGITSKNKTEKAGAERVAVNTPIQGSAADIVKAAMIDLDSQLRSLQGQGQLQTAQMLLQVHDELIFECDVKDEQTLQQLVKSQMEKVVTLSVPLRVSVESGASWGDFH